MNKFMSRLCGLVAIALVPGAGMCADRGCFDMERWDAILTDVRTSATAAGVDADKGNIAVAELYPVDCAQ